jgi:hypothetical protein
MELENIVLSEVSQGSEGQKLCYSSDADYKLKTNAVILLDMGHI